MRTLVIGDIHGYADVLRNLLAAAAPTPADRLITLGDYIDRGPDSRGVLDQLVALKKTHQFISLRGNHDQMMLDARQGHDFLQEWLYCGGKATLQSYGDSALPAGELAQVPEAHWQFLEKDCVNWYETEKHFFVHANADPDTPIAEQPLYLLQWEALFDPKPHSSGKIMVCGHTKQRSGLPRNEGHTICIDTWVYGEGWLTCLELETGRLWQANRHGQSRTLFLDEVPAR